MGRFEWFLVEGGDFWCVVSGRLIFWEVFNVGIRSKES